MIEILQFCNKFAVNAFHIYIIVRLLRMIFKDMLYDKRVLYAVVSVNMIVMLLLDYYVPYVWVNLIISVFLVFMIVNCYETQMIKKAAVTVGINVLLALSEMIVALFVMTGNLSFLTKASNGESVALFLSRILFLVIVTIIMKLAGWNNSNKLSGKVAVLETVVFVILISELIFLCIEKHGSIMMESAILFASEVTVYLLIYLQDCLLDLFESKEQARFIAQEKEYYRREAAIIQQKQELQRQFQHDFKNRIQIFNEIAGRGNISELKKYLSEIEAKHNEQEVFSNTGNLVIDSIINSKLQYAAEKKIAVNSSVMLPAELEVNTDDMVVILGNLLDNAIEACERLKDHGYIKLFMNYEKGCIILRIKNCFDHVISRGYGEFVTRKKDKSLHGLGIKSVKNTVEKYKGIIEFSSEENEFTVNIILYL